MRILYVGPISPPVSGPEVKNTLFIEILRNQGVETIEFNTCSWKRNILNAFTRFSKLCFSESQAFISVAKWGRFSLVPIFYLKKMFWHRTKYVLFPVGGSFGGEIKRLPKILRNLYLICLKSADQLYVETNLIKQELNSFGLKNVQVLPNARLPPETKWRRQQNKIRKVIYISRINPEKGVRECLEACDVLNNKGTIAHFYFYGPIENSYKQEFLQAIAGRECVSYEGVISPKKVNETLIGGDVFILPSYREGLPGALVEAMLAGMPIVVSNLPVFSEYIQDRQNALTVKPGNVAQIVEALKKIFHDSGLASKLSVNAIKTAENFDVNKIISKIMSDIRSYGWN